MATVPNSDFCGHALYPTQFKLFMRGNCTEDLATFYLPINVLLLVAVINSLIDKNTYDNTLKYVRQYRKMNEKFCL